MAIPVFILGETGSGKSYSLRNFEPGEVLVLNVANKLLPFRKKLDMVNNATYNTIAAAFADGKYKTYVIDDSQYLLVFDLFNKANQTGYEKFTKMAVAFEKMIEYIIMKMPQDSIVFLLHHTQAGDDGVRRAKTVGKMLDSYLSLEGLVTICLYCENDNGKHGFVTQSDGTTTAKSPEGMFPLHIDNDLKMVADAIRDYYGLEENNAETN